VGDNRQLVYWRGTLKNGSKKATCTVQAWEEKSPDSGLPVYTRQRVIRVSRRLPDGVYDLEAQGQMLRVRRANGFWTLADADTPDDPWWNPARIFKDAAAVGGIVSAMLAMLVVLRLVGDVAIR
jgi:hypothetical protein